jgi:hypothetical protein
MGEGDDFPRALDARGSATVIGMGGDSWSFAQEGGEMYGLIAKKKVFTTEARRRQRKNLSQSPCSPCLRGQDFLANKAITFDWQATWAKWR